MLLELIGLPLDISNQFILSWIYYYNPNMSITANTYKSITVTAPINCKHIYTASGCSPTVGCIISPYFDQATVVVKQYGNNSTAVYFNVLYTGDDISDS